MPFRSEKQRRFLWMHHPEIAKKWTKEHGSKIVPSKKKKNKKKKKSAQDYRLLIIRRASLLKESMGAGDYYSHLSTQDHQLIATLPNKNKPEVAYAAVKVINIIKNYYTEIVSALKTHDPKQVVDKLLNIVRTEVSNEYEKIKDVASHIINAVVQKAGRVPTTASMKISKRDI